MGWASRANLTKRTAGHKPEGRLSGAAVRRADRARARSVVNGDLASYFMKERARERQQRLK